jgi:hypothetical protein
MEHLIFALHNHAFLLLAISIGVLLSLFARWLQGTNWDIVFTTPSMALLYWIPMYFLFSLKRVYTQSWKKTIVKFFLIGFCYLFVLSLAILINLTLGLLML